MMSFFKLIINDIDFIDSRIYTSRVKCHNEVTSMESELIVEGQKSNYSKLSKTRQFLYRKIGGIEKVDDFKRVFLNG